MLSDPLLKVVFALNSFGRHLCDRYSQVQGKHQSVYRGLIARVTRHCSPNRLCLLYCACLLKKAVVRYRVWELASSRNFSITPFQPSMLLAVVNAHFSLTCILTEDSPISRSPPPPHGEGLTDGTNSRNVGGTSLSSWGEPSCHYGFWFPPKKNWFGNGVLFYPACSL